MSKQIVVIGGGAAGMVASIVAARKSAAVVVIERMQRVGKKLLATGNGRCNLSNRDMDMRHYHGRHPEFAAAALEVFGVGQTLAFFEELGVEPCVEADGKVYPRSGQASSVLDVLRAEMTALGVAEVCDKRVQRIDRDAKGLRCVCTDESLYLADRVIMAAGGKAAPNLGSNGGGFKIAEGLGHTIVETFPALVQLRIDAPFLKRLQGLKFEGSAEIYIAGQPRRRESGEILFTDYGISGPPILQLSRIASEHAERGEAVALHLDVVPELALDELVDRIRMRTSFRPEKTVEDSFVGFIHKRLIPVLLAEAEVDGAGACGALSDASAWAIAGVMKDWPLTCAGVQSWMHAQVTAGGVDTNEVNPDTMESKRAPGVFFAGEVLDIDGDCGGYNLQWAWSSGYVAGTHAAE